MTGLVLQAAEDGVKPAGKAAKDAAGQAKQNIPEPGQAQKVTQVAIPSHLLNGILLDHL